MMDPSVSRQDSDHRDHRRYDVYGLQHVEQGSSELIPAATVIVLRDAPDGIETLMLHKNSKIAFGGMWVFPGGRIDLVATTDGGQPSGEGPAGAAETVTEAHGAGILTAAAMGARGDLPARPPGNRS